ncbi:MULTISPECIES: efflux RND transporter periplasmic adaptor subunit [Myroides]|uniref:Efflux RND transporter periplasmic adaptor subunit n=1 Tax=Myroides albus TaxID=2562892 RepID=A0A6I3LIT6_9FLAO|nr:MULTISPECIES: efflux RND transporter periplasmic adaptor subunit [Myroides]MTG98488.1 efflux RND transporter periplasmic adaptor subunit [Myroides albus]MVX34459.1 efflux RND transporter periplasmic adaptor subunit [Myroides sp. LoEW2-1]UVD78245.1 efflux RND transporter periplasmic adaptor subunit [Myroides albus]
MKRYFHTIVLASLAITAGSCGKKEQQAAHGPLPYKVVQVPTQTVIGHNTYPTTLQGKVTSNVRAKIAGYIQELYVDEGSVVRKGQPLFRLETNTLNENANAALAAVKAAEAQVSVAQVNYDKLVPLVNKGIISKIQLDTAEATLNSAKGQLANAKAQHQSIVANIDYAIIKSPIDGIVGAIPFRVGSLVSPSDPQPLTVVSDNSEMYAYFSMNEKEYFNFLEKIEGKSISEKLKHLPEVKLVLANGQTYSSTGKIETMTGQVNLATGTVQVRASFPNTDNILSNGNSGSLLLPVEYKDVLVVPESSTFEQQGQIYVYRVVNDTAKAAKINVIDRVNKLAIVKEGVAKGETIVGTGLGTLRNGSAITPDKVEFNSINEAIKSTF